ncbi:MAG: sulfotransferase domain-containing protein [Oceanicaulis sp.]|nr:sulfotransferase domain-containing protein [Oceanicaulis sp.]MCH8489380.1 sulfotransferase domain-containing protein [Oceanicaulis sp.]
MLIINNGIPKSGSTWVQRIIRYGMQPARPSQVWQKDIISPSIKDDDIAGYYASGEWRGRDVLLKHHLIYNDNLSFISDYQIRVIVSFRDLPDSVISWFHHNVRLGNTSLEDKSRWLETSGRAFAVRVLKYRRSWEGKPNTLMIRYEDLLADPKSGITTILEFLGEEAGEELVDVLHNATKAGVKPDGPLHEGKHIRTGGRRVARDELPGHFYDELLDLQAQFESGSLTPEVLSQFKSSRKTS